MLFFCWLAAVAAATFTTLTFNQVVQQQTLTSAASALFTIKPSETDAKTQLRPNGSARRPSSVQKRRRTRRKTTFKVIKCWGSLDIYISAGLDKEPTPIVNGGKILDSDTNTVSQASRASRTAESIAIAAARLCVGLASPTPDAALRALASLRRRQLSGTGPGTTNYNFAVVAPATTKFAPPKLAVFDVYAFQGASEMLNAPEIPETGVKLSVQSKKDRTNIIQWTATANIQDEYS